MPVKIGLVAQKLVRGDGQGRAALELARALAEAGNQLTVYAREIDDDVAARVAFRRLRRPPGPQIVDDIALLVQATIALRSERHDVCVVMGHSAIAPRPFVYYAQFSHKAWRRTWRRGARPSWRHRVHAVLTLPLEALVARRATAVLAPSAATAEVIPAPRGARRGVVANGVDPPERRLVDRPGARRALGVPNDAFVVGFVGEYYTGRKGLDLLVEAVALGADDEHLLIAGSGPADALHRDAARAGIAGRVHVLGFTSPAVVYDASDVVAVPSRYEPFSLVALEAAASGVAVIVAACAGAAEHLGDAAVIVDQPVTSATLRAALDRLRDDELRGRLAGAGQARAGSLSWAVTSEQAARFVLATIART